MCLGVALLFGGCGDNNTQGDLGSTPDQSGAADLGMDLSPPSDGMLADGMSGDGSPDALMCTANSFIACAGNTATFCNSTGDGTTDVDCGAPCVAGGCGQCTADACTGGTLTPCDVAHGKTGAPTACVTLKAGGNVSSCNAAGDACAECAGAFVCGSGTTGTANTQYACNGDGTLGTATACAFGCDDANGKCKDLVPASDADAHLAAADTFTCTGTQSAALPAVTAAAGDTLTIDSTTATIQKKNGATVTNYAATWGAAYTPAGSGTPLRVAHIKSLAVTAGATVKVTGSKALVLLVDGDVRLAGAVANTTLVDLNGSRANGAGPGAPSANGAGGTGAGSTGGGGAGHGTVGAHGGGAGGNAGGAAGALYGAAVVLEAGTSGGNTGLVGGTAGGVGGGGLQVSACGNIAIDSNVVFNASGGGGGPGGGPGVTAAGGTGGGAGGSILLEAASFNATGAAHTIAGELVSNGGGGGGGGDTNNAGAAGGEWDPTKAPSTVAAGGAAGTANAGAGGNGGAGATIPTIGADTNTAGNSGGGGGGAYGRVFLNVSPTATAPTAAAASPAPKASTVCVTVNGAAPASCTYP